MGQEKEKKPVYFQRQAAMLRVVYALAPLATLSVYLFGWRSLALLAVVLIFGLATEAAFALPQGKPVTSAALVTCFIFHLSLPPALPFWVAVVGIVFAIGIGKMAFGGFGRNIFNPAMAGRCFIYVTFPVYMTGQWPLPMPGPWGGLLHWASPLDAVSRATPLAMLKAGVNPDWTGLFLGNTAGSLGETGALLILACGAYIIFKGSASWRLAGSFLLGGLAASLVLLLLPIRSPGPLPLLLSGAFMFGCVFVITEPISGPKTPPAQWIYGTLAGSLTIVLRAFSNFSEGVMFSVLILNAFAPLLDQSVRFLREKRQKRTQAA